ncbi:hypothetical protein pb186bvf_012058 [Paramecium bursaria]
MNQTKDPFIKTPTLCKIPPNLTFRKFYKVQKNCQICHNELLSEDIIRINCGDTFHKGCIFELIKYKISQMDMNIECPTIDCKQKISKSLLARSGFKKKELENYFRQQLEQLLIKNPQELASCPTPGCDYIFKFDTMSRPDFTCDKCYKSFCLKCQSEQHPMFSCEEFQLTKDKAGQEKAFYQMMDNLQCRQCGNCKLWISKTKGCNHMVCKCSYEFCYKCGRKYRHPDCKCPLFDRPS